jgi:hypothetical protein
MRKSLSPLLRTALAVLLISPSVAVTQAAAQVVGAAAISGASASSAIGAAGAVSRAPLALGSAPLSVPSISVGLVPSLTASPALAASALTAIPAASVSAAAPAPSAASAAAAPAPARALAAAPAAADGPTPLQAPLRPGEHGDPRMGTGDTMVHDGPRGRWLVPLSSFEQPLEPSDWNASRGRLNKTFDGSAERGSAPDVDGKDSSAPSILAKPDALAASARTAAALPVPSASPIRRTGTSFAVKALLVAALLLAVPGVALAAPVAGPLAVHAASLSFLASIHPTASAAGALAGMIYGMFAARPKDGSAASTGDMFASILRYGVLGGAGAYTLLNLTQLAFGGAAIGLEPLTSAIAIAALGHTAFQEKFMYPTTTSADRIFSTFPAVAAAVGISVAVGLSATALAVPTFAAALATNLMASTGVATALYAAIFKPGVSPIDGPALMAKGFVLQALMMGLALAMTNQFLFWQFALMGLAGYAMVLYATAREIWAHRPGAPAQPLPPAPPASTGTGGTTIPPAQPKI